MLLQKCFFLYLVVEFHVEIFVANDVDFVYVDFVYVLLDIEDTLGVGRLVVHFLVVRLWCSQRCSPCSCCELAVEQLFFSSLL